MSTKIAFISDIHGNLEAAKTVFKDIKKRGVDKIICLGDIVAKGSHPNECIELVRKNCFVVLSGNTDRVFSSEHNLDNVPKIERKRVEWNQSLITKENREYLQSLPFTYEFYMSGSLIRVFHATPAKDNIPILNIDSVALKSTLFEPTSKTISDKFADIVLYGHIHHQYMDKLYNKTLINAGSVGNAFDTLRLASFDSNTKETTNAHYVIIEGDLDSLEYGEDISFQFVRIPYNITKELEDLKDNLEPESYYHEITRGMYRDTAKVEEGFKERGTILRK